MPTPNEVHSEPRPGDAGVDEERSARLLRSEELATGGDTDPTIEATTDQPVALEGADYVINMITVGGTEPFENETRIPENYGVEQAIVDPLGPGGVFCALRTILTVLNLAPDMEELYPDPTLLNYTNPMAIGC